MLNPAGKLRPSPGPSVMGAVGLIGAAPASSLREMVGALGLKPVVIA
jgi:hypothetical protein